MNPPFSPNLSRRSFLTTTATAAVGSTLVSGFPAISRGATDDRQLKVALVGCGGRGNGAANQALAADKNAILTAVADVFPDQIEKSLRVLAEQHGRK
jgi:Zn-dependent alcohol dehydrogenase